MNDTFFGTDPAQLGVRDKVPPGLAPVADERGEGATLDAVGDVVDCFANDIIAAANGEGL